MGLGATTPPPTTPPPPTSLTVATLKALRSLVAFITFTTTAPIINLILFNSSNDVIIKMLYIALTLYVKEIPFKRNNKLSVVICNKDFERWDFYSFHCIP